MLRSLISNPAKTTSHICMASIPSPLPPARSFPLLKCSHSALCTVQSKSNPVLFSESKSPCGFVTVGTSWSWDQDCYCLISWKKRSIAHTGLWKKWKEKLIGWGFVQAALAEFPHTSLVTPNTANLRHFKTVTDMKYSTAVLLLLHTVQKKKEKPVHALPAHF